MKNPFGLNKFGIAASLSILVSGLFAQEVVNITGKVTDQTGTGLAGVTVVLKKNKASAVTGADGTYHLDGVASINRRMDMGPSGLSFDNRILEFDVPAGQSDVRVSVFNLAGKPLASVFNGALPMGHYRINPFVAGLKSQIAFLHVRIGEDAYTLKMFGFGDRSLPAAGLVPGVLKSSGLSKAAMLRKASAAAASVATVAIDTLAVSKTGWSSDKLTVDSLRGAHDFILVQPEVFWGDPAGYPAAKNVMTYVLLNRTNGKYADNQVFWTWNGQTHSLAEQSTIDMPVNPSGRVTFHLETATGKYWDFIEHTISATVWNGNTTRVDGYGIPIAIRLICGDGKDEMLGEKYDVFYKGRDAFIKDYKASVPVEFYPTVDNSAPYRIVAPGKGDGGFNVGQKYATYFDGYLKELGITGATTNQAFACAGTPFGSNSLLAGAVNRHVAQLPQAEWQNAENFYKQAPANYYAKFFHDHSFQNKAYGFAYDDAAGYAAYSSCSKPKYLIVAIGF